MHTRLGTLPRTQTSTNTNMQIRWHACTRVCKYTQTHTPWCVTDAHTWELTPTRKLDVHAQALTNTHLHTHTQLCKHRQTGANVNLHAEACANSCTHSGAHATYVHTHDSSPWKCDNTYMLVHTGVRGHAHMSHPAVHTLPPCTHTLVCAYRHMIDHYVHRTHTTLGGLQAQMTCDGAFRAC